MTTSQFNKMLNWNFWTAKSVAVVAPELNPAVLADKGANAAVCLEDRLDIVVGRNSKARTWKLHKDLIVQNSGHFASAIKLDNDEVESFALENEDPAVFHLFVDWLYSTVKDIPVGGPESELVCNDPWVTAAPKAWDLAQRLQAARFARFVLVKFVQSMRWQRPDVLIHIFHDRKRRETHCALQRVVMAWLWHQRRAHAVLWIAKPLFLTNGDLDDPYELALVRKMMRDDTFSDKASYMGRTLDPHWYPIEHWFEDCADKHHHGDPSCVHRPHSAPTGPWSKHQTP